MANQLGELLQKKYRIQTLLKSTVFVASRQFGKGHVLAYAQDGLYKA